MQTFYLQCLPYSSKFAKALVVNCWSKYMQLIDTLCFIWCRNLMALSSRPSIIALTRQLPYCQYQIQKDTMVTATRA